MVTPKAFDDDITTWRKLKDEITTCLGDAQEGMKGFTHAVARLEVSVTKHFLEPECAWNRTAPLDELLKWIVHENTFTYKETWQKFVILQKLYYIHIDGQKFKKWEFLLPRLQSKLEHEEGVQQKKKLFFQACPPGRGSTPEKVFITREYNASTCKDIFF